MKLANTFICYCQQLHKKLAVNYGWYPLIYPNICLNQWSNRFCKLKMFWTKAVLDSRIMNMPKDSKMLRSSIARPKICLIGAAR